MVDTCDWCGSTTNSIQIKTGESIGLCPSCCPDIDENEEVPDGAPRSWYHMSEEERVDWLNGMSMEEIMDKYDWHTPPERPNT